MPSIVALEVESKFLDGGHFFGFETKVGKDIFLPWFVVRSKQFIKVNDWALASTAHGAASGWTRPADATLTGSYFLEPDSQDMFYQIFWGQNNVNAFTFTQYPPKKITPDLKGLAAVTSGGYGGMDRDDTDYDDPSFLTELLTIKDVQGPSFNVYNNTGVTITPYMNFLIMKYRADMVVDPALIAEFNALKRKAYRFTLGPVDDPLNAPTWLSDMLRKNYKPYDAKI